MPSVKTLPLHLLTRRLRLRITLSDRISDIEIDVLRKRMTAYVTAIGLSAQTSPDGFTVAPGRRAAWARDRGAVLDWLMEQPEVAQVQVEPAGKGGGFLRLVFSPRR